MRKISGLIRLNNSCVVGSTGFVGSTLKEQAEFSEGFSSANIDKIRNTSWDVVVCAAAPAQKWLANSQPEKDLANLQNLWSNLETVQAKQFILISTVDVFEFPIKVDESTSVGHNSGAYGRNRSWLEEQVRARFSNHLIARLPGLVGTDLRKNIIYDFKHNNNLDKIESRAKFQFYPMSNLWKDLNVADECSLEVVHLTAEPISVARIAALAGIENFKNEISSSPAAYDFRTNYAHFWGAEGDYQYSAEDSASAIKKYLAETDINE